MKSLLGMAMLRSVNAGNVCPNKMVLGYFDSYFFFFGYISHFPAPLKTADIAIKR